MNPCNCDYDAEGDPLRYVKVSHSCPVHDECEECQEAMGTVRIGRYWLCAACATCECGAVATMVLEDGITCRPCAIRAASFCEPDGYDRVASIAGMNTAEYRAELARRNAETVRAHDERYPRLVKS